MVFDDLIVAVILAGAALGAWNGLAWRLAAIFSPVAGFVVGIPASQALAPLFGSNAPLNRFVAFAVVFALVSLAFYPGAFCYREAISKWQLQRWDRHLVGANGRR